MVLKVIKMIIFMPYVFATFYGLDIPFTSLVYFKHLSLRVKQKRNEGERKLSTSQISENGFRLLSKKRKSIKSWLSSLERA